MRLRGKIRHPLFVIKAVREIAAGLQSAKDKYDNGNAAALLVLN